MWDLYRWVRVALMQCSRYSNKHTDYDRYCSKAADTVASLTMFEAALDTAYVLNVCERRRR